MPRPTKISHGFTLIELMLAMAFFTSILLLTTTVIVQVLGIYSKGLVVRQINSIGRSLTDDVIRVSNGSAGIKLGSADTNGKIRCFSIGDSVYVWSYPADTTTEAYTVGPDKTIVNLSRYVAAGGNCPTSRDLSENNLEPLLSDNARVYEAKFTQIRDNLLGLRLVLGTYSPLVESVNPTIENNNVSCQAGSIGNYCAFGAYETVIYLPNE